MQKLITFGALLLTVSGLVVSKYFGIESNLLIYLHILAGFFYSVVFILYVIDHLMMHKRLLKTTHPKNLSGIPNLVLCSLVLFSGFVLYLYASRGLEPWSSIHLVTTLLFLGVGITHIKQRKRKA